MRQSLIATTLSVFLLGCGGGDLVGLDDPSFDSDSDGILNQDDACPGEPETVNGVLDGDGCPDTPLEFYEAIRMDLGAVLDLRVPCLRGDLSSHRCLLSFSSATTTGCGVVYPQNVEYCSRGEGVYYDLNMLQESLDLVGDMGPALILSHAIGGHISWLLEWSLWLTPNTLRLQADCWGGAWASDASARGWLDVDDPEVAVGQIVRLYETPGRGSTRRSTGLPNREWRRFGLAS